MRMRVLQLANGYLDKALYANLFDHMDQQIIENLVFVPVGNNDRRTVMRADVQVLPCFSQLDRFLFFGKQNKIISGIENTYKEQISTISLTHAHTLFSTGYAAMQLKKQKGIPYVTAVRNTDVNLFLKRIPIFRGLGNKIMREAENVIFLSTGYKQLVLDKYTKSENREEIRQKAIVLPNGIDDRFFSSAPNKGKRIGNNLHIIHVGDINKNKNVLTTLAAIEILRSKGYTIEYSLIGDMKDNRIGSILKERSFVKIYPKCGIEEVIRHYRESDILVMPSFHETFGLVYAEAMSQGLPVIYSKGQGFDGQFEQGEVGYAVSPDSVEEIVAGICNIMDGYSEMSERCIRLSRRYKWSRISSQYVDLYQKAVSEEKE